MDVRWVGCYLAYLFSEQGQQAVSKGRAEYKHIR